MTLHPLEKQSRRLTERHFAGKDRRSLLRCEVLQRTRRAFQRASGEFPPTNLELIGKNLGVHSIKKEPIALEGLLVWEEGKYSIKVRRDRPPARQRFTIAHELGHLIVREAGNLALRPTQARMSVPCAEHAWEEELCDYVAAQLLIPDDWAWAFVNARRPDFSTIAEMARLCETSLEVAARRLVEEARGRCRLLWWKLDGSQLRAARSFPHHEWMTLNRMCLPESNESIIARVLADGRPRAGTQPIEVEGSMQNYRVEAWKAAKDTVASLLVFERPPRIAARKHTLFDQSG